MLLLGYFGELWSRVMANGTERDDIEVIASHMAVIAEDPCLSFVTVTVITPVTYVNRGRVQVAIPLSAPEIANENRMVRWRWE